MCLIVTNLRLSYYLFTTYGIIYDTHGANIYIKICTTKFLYKILKWEWFIKKRLSLSHERSVS